MKKIVLVVFVSLFIPALAFAAPPVVDIPSECTVVDTEGTTHTYSGYLGICALHVAKEQGAVSAYTLQNFSFGLFLESLNGIVPGATEFWSLSHNGAEASVGLTDLPVAEGDTLSFQLTDWSTSETIGSPIEISIGSLLSASPEPAAGGGLTFFAPNFDSSKAVLFLKSALTVDGAMPNALLSDWAAFAFTSHDIGDGRSRLREYFLRWEPELSTVTDHERHAMALMTLGIDPYSGTGVDYIAPIVEAFDGTQIGETSLINDDIFAVFPLLHAGYRPDDQMLERIRETILTAQESDGSWAESVDLTAAAIQALSLFERTGHTHTALNRAEWYLAQNLQDDGSFGNSFSTAWAIQAISAIGNSHIVWAKGGYHTPRYYLSEQQEDDGGVEPGADFFTRLWATAYAVPAVSGRTWDSLMAHFPKPSSVVASSPVATSTSLLATSTPAVATSTASEAPATTTQATNAETVAPTPATDVPLSSDLRSSLPSSGEVLAQAPTSTPENTVEPQSQAAAAAGSSIEVDMWLWLLGLVSVLGSALYLLFFRRA